jgi:hypothetical protein
MPFSLKAMGPQTYCAGKFWAATPGKAVKMGQVEQFKVSVVVQETADNLLILF